MELPSSCYDVEKDTLAFTKVDTFLPNKIYYQGCLKTFLQITKWNGPEVHPAWQAPFEYSDIIYIMLTEYLELSTICDLLYHLYLFSSLVLSDTMS